MGGVSTELQAPPVPAAEGYGRGRRAPSGRHPLSSLRVFAMLGPCPD